ALESVTTQFRVVARELPAGSHAAATPVVPAALVRRALALPATVNEQTALPYLGTFVAYSKDAATGVAMDVGSVVQRDGEAGRVSLGPRGGAGAGGAARAAALGRAQPHAETVPTSPPGQSAGLEYPASDREAIARSEPKASEVNRLATAQQPNRPEADSRS